MTSRSSSRPWREADGTPLCDCGIKREFLRTDDRGFHIYAASPDGCLNRKPNGQIGHPKIGPCRIEVVIDPEVDLEPLIEAVSKPLGLVGPRQSERAPIVKAHFLAFIYPSKIESVSALHQTLMNNPALRDAAGFSGMPPSRSTLSRAFRDMARFPELVERATADLVCAIKNVIPDLGREIAIDSTPVKSNSNPNFDPPSDPDAVWIRRDKAGAKGGLEWEWGHRLQIAVDANYDLPLWIKLSRENNDSPQLVPLLEDMEANKGAPSSKKMKKELTDRQADILKAIAALSERRPTRRPRGRYRPRPE